MGGKSPQLPPLATSLSAIYLTLLHNFSYGVKGAQSKTITFGSNCVGAFRFHLYLYTRHQMDREMCMFVDHRGEDAILVSLSFYGRAYTNKWGQKL